MSQVPQAPGPAPAAESGAHLRLEAEALRVLQQSEHRYRSLVQMAPDAIWIVRQGRIVLINQAVLELLGADGPERVLGRSPLDFIHPDYRASVRERVQRMQMGGSSMPRMEEKIVRLDGTVVEVEAAASYLADLEGGTYQAFLRDITEHKRAERWMAAQRDLAVALSASTRLEEALRHYLRAALRISGVECGGVYQVREEDRSLHLVTHAGLSAAFVARVSHYAADSPNARLVFAGAPVYARLDNLPQLDQAVLREEGLRCLAVIPAVYERRVIAVLNLASRECDALSPGLRPALEVLGSQIGGAILRIQSQEAREHLTEELAQSRARLQDLSRRLLDVQESERRHLARELHDAIGQALSFVKTNLHALRAVPFTASQCRAYDAARETVDRLLKQVRQLSLELRPALLDDLGLVPALRWLAQQVAEHGRLTVNVQAEATLDRFAPTLESAAFRVVQEALTNVLKHAQATRVDITLRRTHTQLVIGIGDNGAGFEVERVLAHARQGQSLGLLGMAERTTLAGGQFQCQSDPGRGTTIQASFPIDPIPAAG